MTEALGFLSQDEARDLLDIPATVTTTLVSDLGALSYTGNALKLLRVNATADGWEFHALASADITGALGYTPTSVTGLTGAQSVAAFKTGLSLVKGDVGLGSVDNTSDAGKPVSTAQQAALDLKAPLASPALTGTPTAPTAADATSSTQIASTAFVHSLITNLINASPAALDTLKELADAIGDDPNFAATVATSIATKVAKSSNLSDLTNAATARANLGVAVGTDVQAYDAELAALAALVSAADKLPYFTGVGTAALFAFTSAIRTALSNLSGTNTGDQTSVSGNAGTATKLATARAIAMSGDVTWSANFDGSADASAAGTIANDAVTNAKAANMADGTIKGRASGAGAGDPTDLTPLQGRTVLRSACMAKLSADLTAQNWSGGFAITWTGADEYDEANWHDPVTNNNRHTVPSGVDRVELGYDLQFNNVTAGTYIYILVEKNGASFPGSADFVDNVNVTNPRIAGSTGPIACAAGDYFSIVIIVQDTSVDLIAATSAFWIKAA